MGDFIFDWNEGTMNVECPNNGIPIPRNQHTQSYLRSDFGSQNYMFDNDSPNLCRPPLVPPNSLTSNSYISSDNQRNALSPLNPVSSPFMMSSSMDDIEIKMEPLEEFLDIGNGTNLGESHPAPLQEDNLLDNVNFEDLLMTDDMDSSTTTCLDPQHSSPAAMATVHPDEVLGLIRSDNEVSHASHSFSSSVNVPLKAETSSFGGIATSFPPQGIGWKDLAENQSIANRFSFNNISTYQSLQPRNITKENSEGQNLSSRIMVLQNEFVSSQTVSQGRKEDLILPFNNNESGFTQMESTSNIGASSALHDLLTNSSQISNSPQSLLQSCSDNINISTSSLKGISNDIPIGQSVPGAASFLAAKSSYLNSRLSSSAPVSNFSFEQMWQRREPRQHLLSTSSLAEEAGGSTSSLSTGGGILSPMPHDLSIDEGIDSEEDSDGEHYDSDSDNDSIMSEETISLSGSQGNKKERHFWQYNVQAKGPKGHRVNITQSETDPHQLDKIMDPVFSPLCSIQGIKHSGKARRGDGNDLTPSPRKLVNIGIELNKLNKKINEMTPVSELPSTVRSKSRKEKNKLASRACRLKKKAQHEANKIKLHGLEQEHKSMMSLINKAKDDLFRKMELAVNIETSEFHSTTADSYAELSNLNQSEKSEAHVQMQQILTKQIENAAKMRTKQRIAGYTTEFVNKVIENCKNGNSLGGLEELSQTFVKTASYNEAGMLNFNNELYT
ncbi:UNVERIFIED_CONTAM: hypothetical protein RMT77_000338 [Armadillidium vulgare]